MATAEKTAKVTETKEATVSLLDQAIASTKQTEPDRAKELLRTLTDEALKGTVTYSKNLTVTFNKAIQLLDEKMSKQLNAIIHDPKFLKLEGSWRGLNYLIMNSETSSSLKIRVVNMSKRELYKDLSKAVEFDQSQIFKKIYENEFGTPGGDQQDQWTLWFFLGVVEFGLNLQQAIDAASFHTTHFPSSFYPRRRTPGGLVLEDRIPEATRKELAARGHKITVTNGWANGRVMAAQVGPKPGVLSAAASPRGQLAYVAGD